MRDPIIDRLEVARDALSKAVTLVPVKQLHSMAAAAETYARQQGLSEDVIGFAHQVKIEALARLGEIMQDTPKAKGGQPYQKTGGYRGELVPVETLAEQGVDKQTASLARRLSALSDVDLNAVAARDKTLVLVRMTARQKADQSPADVRVEPGATTQTTEFKFWDKLKGLELVGKLKGFMKPQLE